MFDLSAILKQKIGERVVYLLRRHWIVFFADVTLLAVLAAVPVGVWFWASRAWPDFLMGNVGRPAAVLVGSSYYLILWTFFMVRFIDYYLDTWIVTTDKILNIEQNGLFSRTVSELDLAVIQDVTSEVHGIVHTVFNFGNVHIQTAAEKQRFVFEQVPKPHEIRKHILELVEADKKRQAS